MSSVNWGMIGCGDVAEKRNGPAFNKPADSNLVAVMRRDAEKAADYARRHNVSYWYNDADEMMKNKDINAIYIATPPAFHMAYALTALKKGFNVYVEKPVTRNAAEAREIANAHKQYPNQKLTVAHYRRALPLFLKVKQLLKDQMIGEPRTIQIRTWQCKNTSQNSEKNWVVQPELSGGGHFHSVAPHQIDMMLFLFGEPEKYQGFSLNQSGLTAADDHVCGQILFKNNVVFNGSWCFNVAENLTTDTCEIIGTKGKITFPFSGTYVSWKNETDEQTLDFVYPQYAQEPMIEKIVAYFKDEGPNPSSIDEAVIVMEIMDAFTLKR